MKKFGKEPKKPVHELPLRKCNDWSLWFFRGLHILVVTVNPTIIQFLQIIFFKNNKQDNFVFKVLNLANRHPTMRIKVFQSHILVRYNDNISGVFKVSCMIWQNWHLVWNVVNSILPWNPLCRKAEYGNLTENVYVVHFTFLIVNCLGLK